MTIKERRESEKKEMRGLILETAIKLFLEEGYEKVTLRRIAGKIDYSPATIYSYFKDKNDILFALHAVGFEKLDAKQQGYQSIKDPWKRLKKRGEVYLSFAMKNPEYYDLMFIMRGPAKKMREKKNEASGFRSFEMLKKDIQECIDAGYTIKTSAEVMAFAFWSFVHGIASLIIRDRVVMIPREQLNALIEGALAFMMNSMRRGGK